MSDTTLRLEPPLALPKFTFLFGGSLASRYELATALATRDPRMLIQDLEEPLRMATHALFFGGFNIDHDLTKLEERSKELPAHSVTVEAWLMRFREELRMYCGRSALGKIATRAWVEDGNELFFERCVYRDADSEHDILPFLEAFDESSILCIHLDSAPGHRNGIRRIWLPVPALAKRMELLERELKGQARWTSSQPQSSSCSSQEA